MVNGKPFRARPRGPSDSMSVRITQEVVTTGLYKFHGVHSGYAYATALHRRIEAVMTGRCWLAPKKCTKLDSDKSTGLAYYASSSASQ